MPATYADKPTSDWEHSHALAAGDVVEDERGDRGRVKYVEDDGRVCIAWSGDGEELATESEIMGALADGNIKLADGRSHELATF